MLDHAMLRNLRAAAKLVAGARETDVSDLADYEHTAVDEVLTQIIQDAIRVHSSLNKPAWEQEWEVAAFFPSVVARCFRSLAELRTRS